MDKKTEIPQHLKNQRLMSIIVVAIGLTLITYMITVEGELGALPLFLLMTGTIWTIYTTYKIKKLKAT